MSERERDMDRERCDEMERAREIERKTECVCVSESERERFRPCQTVGYDSFIASQLFSRDLLQGLMWCKCGHVS